MVDQAGVPLLSKAARNDLSCRAEAFQEAATILTRRDAVMLSMCSLSPNCPDLKESEVVGDSVSSTKPSMQPARHCFRQHVAPGV